MPVMSPLTSERNFTPSSTERLSAMFGFVGVAVEAQMVHAVQPVGAVGVTELEAAESGPVPTALVAETLNVYERKSVGQGNGRVLAGGLPVSVVGVWAVGLMYGVAVWEVIALPPLPGAVHETVACVSPAVAVTLVGAAGAVGAVGVT